jgi:hypothetical protein
MAIKSTVTRIDAKRRTKDQREAHYLQGDIEEATEQEDHLQAIMEANVFKSGDIVSVLGIELKGGNERPVRPVR